MPHVRSLTLHWNSTVTRTWLAVVCSDSSLRCCVHQETPDQQNTHTHHGAGLQGVFIYGIKKCAHIFPFTKPSSQSIAHFVLFHAVHASALYFQRIQSEHLCVGDVCPTLMATNRSRALQTVPGGSSAFSSALRR